VDVLFVVDDDFVAPAGWKVHFIAKENDWIVYNVKEVPIKVGKEVVLVLVQYMIVKRSYAKTPLAVAEGEKWGVPLKRFFSKHKYITL
jgi:hypothetical protein